MEIGIIYKKEKIAIKNKGMVWVDIIKLSSKDFPHLKKFVLKNYMQIKDKNHFIIDDIDTELPFLLKENEGLVFGIKINGELVAIQAINFNKNDRLNFCKLIDNYNRRDSIMEIGWAMVDKYYQGNGFSIKLMRYLEKEAFQKTQNEICLATVHPHNINSLFVFFKAGYVGYKILQYYGKERIFLLKNVNHEIYIDYHTTVSASNNNFHLPTLPFFQDYVCFNIQKERHEYKFLFAKAINNPTLEHNTN